MLMKLWKNTIWVFFILGACLWLSDAKEFASVVLVCGGWSMINYLIVSWIIKKFMKKA